MSRWLRRIAVALIALAAVFVLALAIVDTGIGHRWVAERIGAIRTGNGLRFTIGRIDGSLYDRAQLKDRLLAPHLALTMPPRATVRCQRVAWVGSFS